MFIVSASSCALIDWFCTYVGTTNSVSAESSGGSRRSSKGKGVISAIHDLNLSPGDSRKGYLSGYYDESLCLGPRGVKGLELTVITLLCEFYWFGCIEIY